MKNTETIRIGDINYSFLLKNIHKAPEKLFYRGDMELFNKPCIAVVGTRKYSSYGEEMTKKIITELSCLDICIVSGLALGIDSIAHRTALECGLPTIAVLGSGIDYIYPAENLGLALEIEKNGLIVSEYPGKFEALRTNFPQRNRIVSGLSIATIVIEAPEKSGALITAKLALEQGREIFTIPGDIDRENSIGPLNLVQRGEAYPISSGQEIIDLLKKQPHLFKLPAGIRKRANSHIQSTPSTPPKISPPRPISFSLSPSQQKIMLALRERRGIDLESLCLKSNLPIKELLQAISIMELEKIITLKSGKYYRNC